MHNILIVEDDKDIQETLEFFWKIMDIWQTKQVMELKQ